MPPTEPSKHTKRSRVKARGQASRQQACGEREGQSLSHRGTAKQRYVLSIWANKAKDGKRSKPSTKARQKAVKRHRFSGKQRRGQARTLPKWELSRGKAANSVRRQNRRRQAPALPGRELSRGKTANSVRRQKRRRQAPTLPGRELSRGKAEKSVWRKTGACRHKSG